MSDLLPISRMDKLMELKREHQMRLQVYPRAVAAKKMSQAKADRQTAIIEAIIKDYEAKP